MSSQHTTPSSPARRPMATWTPETVPSPPAGLSMPLTAAELALLRDFRALRQHDQALIGDIVRALVGD